MYTFFNYGFNLKIKNKINIFSLKNSNNVAIIAGVVSLACVACIIITIVILVVWRRRKQERNRQAYAASHSIDMQSAKSAHDDTNVSSKGELRNFKTAQDLSRGRTLNELPRDVNNNGSTLVKSKTMNLLPLPPRDVDSSGATLVKSKTMNLLPLPPRDDSAVRGYFENKK